MSNGNDSLVLCQFEHSPKTAKRPEEFLGTFIANQKALSVVKEPMSILKLAHQQFAKEGFEVTSKTELKGEPGNPNTYLRIGVAPSLSMEVARNRYFVYGKCFSRMTDVDSALGIPGALYNVKSWANHDDESLLTYFYVNGQEDYARALIKNANLAPNDQILQASHVQANQARLTFTKIGAVRSTFKKLFPPQ
jgi:hypothetical protein